MAYDAALDLAWKELLNSKSVKDLAVRFLSDQYIVDLEAREISSLPGNIPAKDFTAILILHYLASKWKGWPALTGKWAAFKELSGIEGYDQAFRIRSIDPLLKKFGSNPQGLVAALEKLPAKKTDYADSSIIVEVFEGVPVLINIWGGDEEFGPEANMLFDQSISRIFCTEDIVVLAQFVSSRLCK